VQQIIASPMEEHFAEQTRADDRIDVLHREILPAVHRLHGGSPADPQAARGGGAGAGRDPLGGANANRQVIFDEAFPPYRRSRGCTAAATTPRELPTSPRRVLTTKEPS